MTKTTCVSSLLFVICLVAVVKTDSTTDCSKTSPGDGVNVSFKSKRNETGFWISQIGVAGVHDASDLMVNVDQHKLSCPGSQYCRHFVITLTEPPPTPGPGYELFPRLGYYKLYQTNMNFATARKLCADENAHVMIVNSEAEAGVTKQIYARFPKIENTWSWVGVIERGLNDYVTIFGESFNSTGFMRWDPSEPNGKDPGDCIVISKVDGGLHDTPCGGGFPVICEQDLR